MKNKLLILFLILSSFSYAKVNNAVINDLNVLKNELNIKEVKEKFAVPLDLLTLILETESMGDSEKQYWLDIYPSMTNEQRTKLFNILDNEKKKLKALEEKYKDEFNELNKKHLAQWLHFVSFIKHFDNNQFGLKILSDYQDLVNAEPDDYIVKNFINYEPFDEKEIYYFDKNWQLSKTEVEDGFYREVLGKTEQGNLVVQDFYQSNKSPQTSPSVVKNGGNVKSGSIREITGITILFDKYKSIIEANFLDKQGNILSSAKYNQGKIVIAEIIREGLSFLYNSDGKIIAAIYKQPNVRFPELSYFRENGSLFAQVFLVNENSNIIYTAKYYDDRAKPIKASQADEQYLKDFLNKNEHIIEMIKANSFLD